MFSLQTTLSYTRTANLPFFRVLPHLPTFLSLLQEFLLSSPHWSKNQFINFSQNMLSIPNYLNDRVDQKKKSYFPHFFTLTDNVIYMDFQACMPETKKNSKSPEQLISSNRRNNDTLQMFLVAHGRKGNKQ